MDKDPLYFGSKYVEFCATWDDSRRLNYMNGPMVIIASSGMCEAGRIRHHLRHVVSDPDNAIVIVSYQAEGTLGRQIAEGVERVQIFDQWYDLNAAVYVLDGFSGHADRNDLALVVRADRRQDRDTPSSSTASPSPSTPWSPSCSRSCRAPVHTPELHAELRGLIASTPGGDDRASLARMTDGQVSSRPSSPSGA